MNYKVIGIILAAALLAIAGFVYIKSTHGLIDAYPALEKRLAGVFSKHRLNDDTLVEKHLEEKRSWGRRYVHVSAEYTVSRSFSSKSFESELKNRIDNTPFKIAKSGQVITKEYESSIITIRFGRFEILRLQVNKKKKPALPGITRRVANPKVAIVIDDFGYNKLDLDELFNIRQPVTFSILPNLAYSREIAEEAAAKGYEVILHLPLEAHGNFVPKELDTITSAMSAPEVTAMLERDIASVPGLRGVSNHQGSKATEDKMLMTIILKVLRQKNLYFFDSLVTKQSVCREIANSLGVRYAKRDVFLDNTNSVDYIERQLLELRKFAFKNGRAIAICHDRKNTIKALSKMMPEMASDGIRFVALSEVVR